ncbi:MAG: flagellar protein FlaG [Reinekea forsetii]|jgi:flagellar protein FlaG|uniref:flagellar protein FlaG n=1 Tax=Reinekea sp. TaxID=1970455 RepID=UPI00257A5B75|nr:flagellar protein FlaG [Reinekea sp.]MDO7646038.1 flagellar protein FlaG [Reinekea forsetii]MDO7675055.1 flagellar protein FlaG [Reinekea forsetii]
MTEINLQSMQTAKSIAPSQNVEDKKSAPKGAVLSDIRQADMQQAKNAKDGQADKSSDHKAQIQKDEVIKAVAQLNSYVQGAERTLEFQVDDDSGQTVVRVYDKVSEELIRQFPNEEALTLAQRLNQDEPLLLFSAQV